MNQQQQVQNNGPTQTGNNVVINNPMLGSQNNPLMVSNQFFPQANIALQVDPVTQDKIKQIRLNEAKFECWYQFMSTEQVGKIQLHMDKSYSEYGKRLSELTTSKDALIIILKEFTDLKDKCQTRIENQDNDIERKKEQILDSQQSVEYYQKYIDGFEEKISTIRANVKGIAQEYKVSNELVKHEKLENKLLIEMFTCLNYVLYDGSKFDWVAFQKKTFNCKMDKITATDRVVKLIDKKFIAQKQNVKDDKDQDKDKVKVEVVQADNIQYQLDQIIFGNLPEGKISIMQSLLKYEGLQTDLAYTGNWFQIQSIIKWIEYVIDGCINEREKKDYEYYQVGAQQELNRFQGSYDEREEYMMMDQFKDQLYYNTRMADETQVLITNLMNLQITITNAQDKVYQCSSLMSQYLPSIMVDLAVSQSPSKIQ